ncbi:MAG: pre-peptidase C-terminal domain-containing protein, partial [Saprospiraceae bacterium]|nr:pre-peptidase C-terminal domain-containing protein [Saprospiraceae bacterium]
MSNVIYTFFLAVFIQIMIPSQLLSQQIWPGDINNNGVANGIDLLYLGEAFSHQGTQRPNANANWQGQAMGDTWNENFPNGINYAYADADGNGVINGNDLSDALLPNFKKTHGSVTPDVFSQYEGGNSPALYLLPASTTVGAGEMVLIRIMMGSNGAPIQNLQGAAFTFNYDPELVIDGSFQGSLIGSSNGQLGNGEIRSLVVNDDANGITDMAFTHTSGGTINGQTEVGRIMFFIENGIEDDTLLLSLDQIQLIDPDMNILPVAHEPTMLFINGGGTVSACPDVLDPVCGANGVTYLNSCYAEEAGVTDYTEGTCFGGCIDPNDIDPDADCSTNYEPVCGCNNITYLNACAADAAGVSSYTQGPCNLDNCYVPDLILIGAGTSVDNNTGVISVDCPDNDEPVCGCNGITYENSCYAEAAGISFYTSGACSDICVDPDQMDPDATCVNVYEPVCGCNGVTYTNSCYADAAGVVSYTQGTCGANSNWCAEATPIQCGDFLAHETTVGSGNQISSYPGCSNASFAGQDKVYVFNKTSAGDIQIGLEILTPGLDLDLFLLAGDCGQLTCLRSSTSNNSLTNNEGILLENAPIGTYFIVVDGQFSGSNGEYHLEVSCGYLDCSDEQELTCGEPFQYNNMYGNDDVSLYGCDGNIYNVENNGPEVVHYFTVTEAGPVNITLEDLDDNLELFLLDDCDRGACMEYSQNAGTTDEHIGTFLQPGTYYIVVDGYNGAISDYTLTVDCSSNCDFDLDLAATDAACGQNNGSISVVSSGGTPAFLVTYSGPVSGSFTTLSNSCTISNLPGGVYTITKTDANGCSVTQTVNVNSSGNLSVSASTNDAICGEPGAIYVSINNGDAPYTVYVSGPVSGTTVVASSSFTLNALPAGNYDLYIVDGSGCSVTESVQIDAAANAFSFTATPDDALCGQLGSIYIETDNGSGPYTVFLTGPVNGSAVVHAPNFNLINLPGGTYTLTIEDGNWCASTQTVTVNDEDLDVSALPLNGICGEDGALLVSIPNGTPGYTISWSGPENGSTTTNNDSYTIEDLAGGTYTISVTDAQGCSDVFVATVDNNGNAIDTDFMIMDATCDMDGSIWIDINNGTWPFDVEFTGPVSGDFVTSLYEVDIPNLPCGTYTVVITDYNGCSSTLTLNIGCGGDLAIDLDPVFTDCGADNEINVSISGGSPAYIVTWSGPESGTATTSDDSFTIENLTEGFYSVFVTDSEGCSASSSFYLNLSSTSDLDISANGLQAICSQPGSIWLSIFGGSPDYTVIWNGPSSGSLTTSNTGLTIPNLPTGTYSITVLDGNGCSATDDVIIQNSNGNFNVNVSPLNGACVNLGGIYVNIYAGEGPYDIIWTGPENGSITTGNNNYTIPDLPSGSYTVTVIDENGCEDIESVYLFNGMSVVDLNATPTSGLCGELGNILVNVSGGAPTYVITWSSGAVTGSANINSNSFNITNLPSGTYTVTVMDANGCTDYIVTNIDNADDDLDVTLITTEATCTSLGEIFVDIDGGDGPYTIEWSGSLNGQTVMNDDGFTIANAPGGAYTIVVEDSNGCTETEVVFVPESTDEVFLEGSAINGICGANGSIQLDISGGVPAYDIIWTGPVDGSASTANETFTIPNLPSGTYTITVLDQNGCQNSIAINLNNGNGDITIQTTPVPGDCAQNGSIWVDIYGPAGFYSIAWTGPVNGSIGTTNNGYNIPNLPSGTYLVTVTHESGCTDSEQVVLINDNNSLDVIAVANNGVCESGFIHVGMTGGSAPYTVTWTGPVNGSATTTDNFYNITNIPSGTYTVTVVGANGCTDTETVTIINDDGDLEIHASLIVNDCGVYNWIWVDIFNGTGPYIIMWTGPENGTVTDDDGAYEITDLPPGTYTIKVTDANGCMTTVEITIYESQANLLEVVGQNGDCGELGQATATIIGGTPPYSLVWTGPFSGSTPLAGGSFQLSNLPSGTYNFTLTDAMGCVDQETIVISNPDELVVNMTMDNGECGLNGSIGLTFTGGLGTYTITWSGPASGSSTVTGNVFTINDLPTGSYTVTVEDESGCLESETVVINNLPNDLDIIPTPIDGVCDQNGSIWLDILNGVGPYVVQWTGPVSGSVTLTVNGTNIPNLPAGTYTVTVIDANGCTVSETVDVDVAGSDFEVSMTSNSGECGLLGSIDLFISGSDGPYTINWTGPVNGSGTSNGGLFTVSNLPTGQYNVTITDANGCVIVDPAFINNIPDNFDVFAVPTDAVCDQNGFIHLGWTGGVANYTVTWSGPVSGSATVDGVSYNILNLPSGVYTVTVVDGNGCEETVTVTINNIDNDLEIHASLIVNDCGVYNWIWVDIFGGTGPYIIMWTGPVNGTVTDDDGAYEIIDLPPGTYTIKVTDQNGCMVTQVITVYESQANLLDVVGTNGDCGELGTAVATIVSGTPPYTLTWTGPFSGTTPLAGGSFTLNNLPNGTYNFTLTDAMGCVDQETIVI